MGLVRQLGLFWWYWLRIARHGITSFSLSRGFKLSVLLCLGIAFLLFDFFFFWRIISQVMGMSELGELRISFIVRLLNLLFILFLGMVLFSNIITALSTFFLSGDLPLLISSPLSFGPLFVQRFFTTYFHSSWMILLFGLPVFFAYGVALNARMAYYPLVLIVLVPFFLLPAALGTIVTLLLMRYFPARRTHQVIASIGVFFGAGIVVVVRMLKPEEFIRPISAERLQIYDTLLRIPSNPLLPSTWASECILGLIEGNIQAVRENMALLWLSGLVMVYICFILMKKMYSLAYSRSQEGGSPNPGRRQRRGAAWWEGLFSRLQPNVAGFFIKDIKSFFREATQWSQLFLLAAIIFIYLYNIRSIPIYSWFIANFASFLNVGMAGFVLSALAARFVYPAVSLEGRAFWIVQTAPINYRDFIVQKFLFYFIPLLILGQMLVIVSNHFLRVDAYMRVLSMIMMLFITLAIVGLGIGLGAIFPRFRVENAAQIAVGAGGILYMILALMYLLTIITLEAWPVYLHFQALLKGKTVALHMTVTSHGVALLLSLLFAFIPPLVGIRTLRKRELMA